METFRGFFTMIGAELSSKIEFVCSDMWKPYLQVIRKQCSQALNILDRFHIVAKMNDAPDDVRAQEARKMASDGHEPLLKKSRRPFQFLRIFPNFATGGPTSARELYL